jgi:hypothetical protein
MNREFTWACRTLLSYCNIPASPTYIKAFQNSAENQQWVYSIVRTADPGVDSLRSPVYNKCINILNANGVKTNFLSPGGG